MKLTNLTIRDLFTPDAKLTFLVGAGCSVDPPSCLPAGRTMMEAIIDYTCAESEIKKIKELEDLRFEQLIEIIRDRLDPELKIIDIYGLCNKPNIQHFFLAEMMKNGQFVLTTNFDFLIEYALQHSGIPKGEVKIVITKEDFENFSNPQKLYSDGLKILYKIHGSTKNVVTGDLTRDSLIATIQAFGANKEGENVFQLEAFKQPLFTNITKDRSLVVIGYSGSDDFDIVPTLKVLKRIQDIVWINYVHDDGGKDLIYEIEIEGAVNNGNLTKIDQILVDIKRMKYAKRVFRVDVNTTRMVKELLPTQIEISSDTFSIDTHDWLEKNLNLPSRFIKYYIPYKIYYDFDIYDDAMNCSEKILQLAKKLKDTSWESISLNNIGEIYRVQGNYPEALKRYEEALQIFGQLGDLREKATLLNNIGLIYKVQGSYLKGLKRYAEALQIDEQLGDLSGKAIRLNNIGQIFRAQGNYLEALKLYDGALQIDEQLGDLSGKAIRLNNIGEIYRVQGRYLKALKRYEEALQIDEQLGDLSGKSIRLNNIGEIYRVQGYYPEALKRFEEALRIAEQLGDLSGKADCLNNIGGIYHDQGNYPKALKLYDGALQIFEQLGDLSGKATSLNNIAGIYYTKGNYPETLRRLEAALQIFGQLGDLSGKAACLNNIGGIYLEQRNYPKALEYLEKALQILTQLGLGESANAKNVKDSIKALKKKKKRKRRR